MAVSRNVITFNKSNLAKWKAELNGIPEAIQKLEQIVVDNEKLAKQLRPSVLQLDSQITALDVQISQIDSQIAIMDAQRNADIERNSQDHHRPQYTFTDFVSTFTTSADYLTLANDRSKLQKSRQKLNTECSQLKDELHKYERAARNARAGIKDLNERSLELNSLIRDGSEFLQKLQFYPKSSYENVVHYAKAKLAIYDEQYPAHQSRRVRKQLRDILKKIDFIANDTLINSGYSPDFFGSCNKWHFRYALVCGLLWKVLNEVDLEEEQAFAETIMDILRNTHIQEKGDLPDDCKFGETIDKIYDGFVAANNNEKALQQTTDNELRTLEQNEYNSALKKAYNSLGTCTPAWRNQATRVIYAVEFFKKKSGAQEPDVPFFTKVLAAQTQLLMNPSAANQARFKFLADVADGAPSWKKKLGGAMLILLSTILLTACIGLALGTFGVAAPVSFVGITVATTLVAQLFSVSASMVPLFSLFAGFGLFYNGMRHGLSDEMTKLSDQVKEEALESSGKEEEQESFPLLTSEPNMPASAPPFCS